MAVRLGSLAFASLLLVACGKSEGRTGAPADTTTTHAATATATATGSIVPAATANIPTTPVKTGGTIEVKAGATKESFKVGAAWAIPRVAYDGAARASGTSYEIKLVNDQDKDAKPCGSFEILSLGGSGLGVAVTQKGGYVPGAEASFEIPGGAAFVTKLTSGASKGRPAMSRTVDKTSKLTIKSVSGNVLTGSIDASGYGNTVKGDFVAQICPPK